MRNKKRLRNLLIAAVHVLAIPLLHAQDSKVRVKVKADLHAPADDGIGTARMVQGDGSCVVALKTRNGVMALGGVPQPQLDWSLVSINTENMAVIKSDKPKLVWGEGAVALETIEYFNHQFRLIASKPDPQNAKLLLLQQVLSPRALTGKAASIIAELPFDRLGKGPEYFAPNTPVGFTTLVSNDSTKLLLQLTPAGTTRAAGCPVFAMVLDKQMKPIWMNTLTTDPAAKEVTILDTRVDKDGAVWYLVRNVSDPAPKTNVPGFSFSLYRLDSAGQKEVKMDMPNKSFPQDMGIDVQANGTLVCGGIYSDPSATRNECLGIFRSTLDVGAMKWSTFKLFPYDKQIIKKDERLQNNMHLDRVWAKKDGGMYVVTEKAGTETHQVSDLSGKKIDKTEWVNGPLHIMEITPAGELKWYKKIDRDLGYVNSGPGAILSMMYDDVLFIFYNDNEANIEKRKSKLPVDPVTTAKDAIMLEFKGDGTDKGKAILTEGGQGYLNATRTWRIGPGRMGLVGYDGFGKDKTYPVLIEMGSDQRK